MAENSPAPKERRSHTEPDRRAQSAAILRAVADLLEQSPQLPEPDVEIRWTVISGYARRDVPALLALATSVTPGPWRPEICGTGSDWLYLRSEIRGPARRYMRLSVGCPAADIGVESGVTTRTEKVPVWRLPPAVADTAGTPTVERT